jgi:hypothetical protein
MSWFLLGVIACGGGDKADGTGETGDTEPTTVPGECVSGEEWRGGDEESPLMHPGMDCIDCHAARREGPAFAIAGTVFTNLHEPDDCNGRDDVVVEITDADGTVFEAPANGAGNFFLEEFEVAIDLPYTARILVGGVETNAMVSEQNDGACNTCHTRAGHHDAPGRITAE